MRTARLVVCVVLIGGVIGNGVVADARVRTPSCTDAQTWAACGDHVPRGQLPLVFRINTETAPRSVGRADATGALAGAVAEWNRAWPSAAYCDVLCAGGVTGSNFGRDGQNTILWGDPAQCDPRSAGAVATACIFYEGANRSHIAEVDVILNRSVAWKQARLKELASGEAIGTAPPITGAPTWYDLQSVLTHELGHAVGLDDIGSTSASFYQDLFDAHRYTQTMYRWYYGGSTNKRTLDSGDVAGVAYLWASTHDH